jgi:hypothetical protein
MGSDGIRRRQRARRPGERPIARTISPRPRQYRAGQQAIQALLDGIDARLQERLARGDALAAGDSGSAARIPGARDRYRSTRAQRLVRATLDPVLALMGRPPRRRWPATPTLPRPYRSAGLWRAGRARALAARSSISPRQPPRALGGLPHWRQPACGRAPRVQAALACSRAAQRRATDWQAEFQLACRLANCWARPGRRIRAMAGGPAALRRGARRRRHGDCARGQAAGRGPGPALEQITPTRPPEQAKAAPPAKLLAGARHRRPARLQAQLARRASCWPTTTPR